MGGLNQDAGRTPVAMPGRVSIVSILVCACLLIGPAGAGADELRGPTDVAKAGAQPMSLAFSPDGRLVATANAVPGSISIFTVSPKGALAEVPGSPFRTGSGARSVAFSPNGRLLAVANYWDDAVTLYTVNADGALKRAPESPVVLDGEQPASVAFSPDGRLLASANDNQSLSVFSVDAEGRLVEVPRSPFVTEASSPSIAFRPDGRALALADEQTNSLSIFEVASDGTMTRIPGTPLPLRGGWRSPTSVAFSPDGGYIATANTTPVSVSLFSMAQAADAVPNELESSPTYNAFDLAGAQERIRLSSVAFSPDGSRIAATTASPPDFFAGDKINLFTVGDHGELTKHPTSFWVHPPVVGSSVAAFSPDGGVLAAINVPPSGIRRPLSTFNLSDLEAGRPLRAREKRFSLSRVRTRTDGRMSFRVRIPRAGDLKVLATARRQSGKRTTRNRFVFARKRLRGLERGTVTVTLRPNRRGRRLLARQRSAVHIRLWVTHDPRAGSHRTIGRRGVRVG